MPDRKLLSLCERIAAEPDPQKLVKLIDDLARLLDEEGDAIRAKINTSPPAESPG